MKLTPHAKKVLFDRRSLVLRFMDLNCNTLLSTSVPTVHFSIHSGLQFKFNTCINNRSRAAIFLVLCLVLQEASWKLFMCIFKIYWSYFFCCLVLQGVLKLLCRDVGVRAGMLPAWWAFSSSLWCHFCCPGLLLTSQGHSWNSSSFFLDLWGIPHMPVIIPCCPQLCLPCFLCAITWTF